MLSTKQADRIIASGEVATFAVARSDVPLHAVIVHRDRWTITTADGGRFDRSDLTFVQSYADYMDDRDDAFWSPLERRS